MQIPTEWIKEFCGLDTTNDQMAHQLTMAGVECAFLDTSNQEILDHYKKCSIYTKMFNMSKIIFIIFYIKSIWKFGLFP